MSDDLFNFVEVMKDVREVHCLARKYLESLVASLKQIS